MEPAKWLKTACLTMLANALSLSIKAKRASRMLEPLPAIRVDKIPLPSFTPPFSCKNDNGGVLIRVFVLEALGLCDDSFHLFVFVHCDMC